MKPDPNTPANDESAVRRMIADAAGQQYQALGSLAESRTFADAIVVLEGDWGGQIYVVAPIKLVTCSMEALNTLLRDLDEVAWPVNDQNGARVYFERAQVEARIAGGMGGGVITEDIWIHEEFSVRIWTLRSGTYFVESFHDFPTLTGRGVTSKSTCSGCSSLWIRRRRREGPHRPSSAARSAPTAAGPDFCEGCREAARTEEDSNLEARIIWRHLQLGLIPLERGPLLDRSWAERPLSMLLDTLAFSRPTHQAGGASLVQHSEALQPNPRQHLHHELNRMKIA